MSTFVDTYADLLIFQYRDKPKARAHIEALLERYDEVYELLNSIPVQYDIDNAVGEQLDVLGRILGISRTVPYAVPKMYFGFTDNPNALTFSRRLKTTGTKPPFKRKSEQTHTSGELNDYQYRIFLKAKAIKNNAKAYMIDEDESLSLQNAVDFLFENAAYVLDNQDMSLSIYIDVSYDLSLLQYIKQLDLIPRPQGVQIKTYLYYEDGNTFGFTNNPNYKGFSRRLDDDSTKPRFAKKIIF